MHGKEVGIQRVLLLDLMLTYLYLFQKLHAEVKDFTAFFYIIHQEIERLLDVLLALVGSLTGIVICCNEKLAS